MKQYTFEKSPTYKRVEEALRQGTRSVRTLAEVACTVERNAFRIVKHLHANGLVHIARWESSNRGPRTAIYRWGPGEDAKKPERQTAATKCRRYRAGLQAKFAENYGLIRTVQRQHIPGRQVVVGGKVLYQQ